MKMQDLESERKVSTQEAAAWATQNKISHLETSAKQKVNVDEAFHELVREIRRNSKESGAKADGKKVAYGIVARFRFRIDSGTLKLGYHLVRPEEAIEQAFDGVVSGLDDRFASSPILRGTAPEPR